EERIDAVHRAPAGDAAGPEAARPDAPVAPASGGQPFEVSPSLLIRYSALTFNAHRIHWDEPYATRHEGYPGLVVHGPLQATLLLRRAAAEAARSDATFESFEYRLMQPMILGAHTSVVTERSGSAITLAIAGKDN